jgi:hypothetical protein
MLRAALAEGPEAAAAWSAWQQAVGGIAKVESASFRLLPLVYRNLSRSGSDDPSMPVLEGVYRQAWIANNLLVRWAGTVLEALEGAGVPTLMLKGAALAPLHYRDLGARPMDDIDVLVPRARAGEAMDTLSGLRFTPSYRGAREAIGIRHAEELADPHGRVVDLHWSLLWGSHAPEAGIWDSAVPLELGGTATRALGAADQLYHACLHGASWNQVPPLRWIADATLVIRNSAAELDWDRLVWTAISSRRAVPLRAALALLRERLDVPVPDAVLSELAGARGSVVERHAHRAMARSPSAYRYAGLAWLLWTSYREYLRAPDGEPIGFLAFVKQMGRLDSAWQLPLHMASRVRGRPPPVARAHR